jgi:hypothetical protein
MNRQACFDRLRPLLGTFVGFEIGLRATLALCQQLGMDDDTATEAAAYATAVAIEDDSERIRVGWLSVQDYMPDDTANNLARRKEIVANLRTVGAAYAKWRQ